MGRPLVAVRQPGFGIADRKKEILGGVCEMRLGEVGALEMRAQKEGGCEMRRGEDGAFEMRPAEIGAFEMHPAEVSAFEMRPVEGDAFQVRPAEEGGAAKIRHSQVQAPISQLLTLSPGIRAAEEDMENCCDVRCRLLRLCLVVLVGGLRVGPP